MSPYYQPQVQNTRQKTPTQYALQPSHSKSPRRQTVNDSKPRKISQVRNSTSPFANRNTVVGAPQARQLERRPSQLGFKKRPQYNDNSIICVLKVEVDESDEP